MSQMSHAIVTGGTGFIGQHLVDRLLAEGYRVTLLVRDPARILPRHQGKVDVLQGDLSKYVPPLPNADVLFHLAADMHMGHGKAAMLPHTVGGTQRVLSAAKAARVGRFVHVSSQAVYGFDKHYYDADESTPLRPSPYAYCETKRLAEMAVWSEGQLGLSVTVVRPGFVYGPGDRTTLLPVAKALKAGQLKAHIDWGEFDTGCLHVENCVEGIYLAGTHPHAAGQAYNLGDGRVLTIRELADSLCKKLNVPAPEANVPFAIAMVMGHAVEAVWRLLGRQDPPPMSPFLVAMLRRNSGFSIRKARTELGYVPRRQWEESLDQLVGWIESEIALESGITPPPEKEVEGVA